MATKAKTDAEPLWAAFMDYTGVYGPIEVEIEDDRCFTVAAPHIAMEYMPGTRGLKWDGDGIVMSCAYIAVDKKEVMAWLKGVQAVHKMFRSSMCKGK